MRRTTAALAGAVAALSLVACSGDPDRATMAGHVHTLAYEGETLLIGTHEGLWAQAPGGDPAPRSTDPFDVMGFALAGERMLASGHPGPGMDAPADLGLLASADDGVTWSAVSLSGEVDFHRLTASGDVVLGINAHDGRLLRSADRGLTWTDLGTPGLFDLAVAPTDPDVVVATHEDGPVRSTDGGTSFAAIDAAPLLALLAWSGTTLYGIAPDGRVHASSDAGLTWAARGSVGEMPIAVAADGARISTLVGNDILESLDGGATFVPRIVDLSGH
jgi:hypothetical protein